MTSLSVDSSPDAFREALRSAGARRAFFVGRGDGLLASHEFLAPVADAISREPDFDGHEGLFFELGRATGTVLSACLHRTVRGQAAGGVRHWPYDTLGAFVRDGLRLARGMGRKNALAGLWWGGGKGVIAREGGERFRDRVYRDALYEDYGRFMTSLRGCYVTAEDVGTTPRDMAAVFRTTRYTTCIPEAVGGSGNPSFATAKGVVCAMEAALDHLALGGIAGKRVAVQGVGNVGAAVIDELCQRNVGSVVATDVDAELCRSVSARFEGKNVSVSVVPRGDTSIFDAECDVFSPNALGAILEPNTIARLRARIVCGAANNQLADERRDDRALHARGITYVPDFVANRMGIVSCANEQYGSLPDDPAIQRHLGREWDEAVYPVTRRVLERAARDRTTPGEAASALADALSLEPHPVFSHRSRAIVESLIHDRWQDG